VFQNEPVKCPKKQFVEQMKWHPLQAPIHPNLPTVYFLMSLWPVDADESTDETVSDSDGFIGDFFLNSKLKRDFHFS